MELREIALSIPFPSIILHIFCSSYIFTACLSRAERNATLSHLNCTDVFKKHLLDVLAL